LASKKVQSTRQNLVGLEPCAYTTLSTDGKVGETEAPTVSEACLHKTYINTSSFPFQHS
jgi:hypothetical protein